MSGPRIPPPDGVTLPADRLYAGTLLLRARKIRIEVMAGPDQGRVVEVPGPEVRIGTAPESALALTDPTVSRVHVRLRAEEDAIRVIDVASRNGTLLDGVLVRDAYARADSTLVLGGTTLRLRMTDDEVDLPLSERERMGGMIGRSAAMRRVFTVLERAAPTDATVLIEGETGTGKELVAEAIHEESPRATGPFVVFDCSAVSANLIESELFGHVRGAFTGAIGERAGAFEAADGGTLFLDEVGELPLDLQPKLLRVLERREVRRVGSNVPRKVDVRVVAATNRLLPREVEQRRFREDLYYRLAVIVVTLPPLRERGGDIPLLVRHFEALLGPTHGRPPPLPDSVVASLASRTWPGNVRELRNAVARAMSLRQGTSGTTPSQAPPPNPTAIDLTEPLLAGRERVADAYEKAYVEAALAEAGGNISRAADIAKVNRKLIYRAMKRFGLGGRDETSESERDAD